MIESEKRARQHFEELKGTLSKQSPRWWKNHFKSYIDEFIWEHISEKECITMIPCKDEEAEERECIYIHGV
jgi:replication fork clamp-binding protein CrfC